MTTSEEFQALEASDARFFIRHDPLGECWELVDRQTGEPIGSDGGEPEDQLLVRDWWWVVELANRLDRAVADAVKAEREAIFETILGLRSGDIHNAMNGDAYSRGRVEALDEAEDAIRSRGKEGTKP